MNSPESNEKTVYRFDGFVVDAQNYVVTRGDETVALAPRAFDVLVLLLRHSGQVVEKRQMFDEVWGETFVSDNALTKIIKELRQALGDSADHPRYIETVPKRGYKFIGEVGPGPQEQATISILSPVQGRTSRITPGARMAIVFAPILIGLVFAAWVWLSGPGSPHVSTIAVLPFKPLDAGSRDESLELGMAATLITRLSNLRDVVVRPIGSARKFSDPSHDPIKAGEELQADAVLDGSIQKAGDRIRVSVRLLDVRSGTALWSEQFDENFTDIFKVQDSIAQRIASVLALKLSRQEQELLAKHTTENAEAYELYIRGQFIWHRRGADWIRQSLDAYRQALEKDPNFALAHIGVAEAHIMLSGHRQISVDDAMAAAGPSIQRALEIDPNLAQAHNALAEFKYQYQYDWRGAEDEFKIAIELNPNVAWIHQAYGWFLMNEGRFDEANAEMERARQLDPSSLTLGVARGRLYYFSRQYDRAINQYLELLQQSPDDSSLHHALYQVYEQKQMYPEALDSFLKSQETTRMPESMRLALQKGFADEGWKGFVRALLAHVEKSRQMSGRDFPGHSAQLYARLGDKENALHWLERLISARDVSVVQIKIDPIYDPLRDDPRFWELLKRIGLEK